MPVCLLCKKCFNNHVEIDGKVRNLHRRKYCLECSPFGKHNTKKIELKKICCVCGCDDQTKHSGKTKNIKCKRHYICDGCYKFHPKKGCAPWNKGLTIENNPDLKNELSAGGNGLKEKYERGEIIQRKKSMEERKILSEIAKERIRKDPTQHVNSRLANRNKLTYPERLAYTFFKENNINFTSQFYVKEFGLWPDFLLDNKLIVEIDGEQWHSTPEQKENDRIRDEKLMSIGYKVLHFPAKNILMNLKNVFENTNIENINVDEVKSKIIVIERKQNKNYCIDCKCEIWGSSKRCKSCESINRRLHPKTKITCSKEELEQLIKQFPFTKIGKMLGVSDNTVKKKAISLGIIIPKRCKGYRSKNNLT